MLTWSHGSYLVTTMATTGILQKSLFLHKVNWVKCVMSTTESHITPAMSLSPHMHNVFKGRVSTCNLVHAKGTRLGGLKGGSDLMN